MGTYEDIKKIIEYLEEDERRHYDESEEKDGHIYESVQRVDEWLNSPFCPLAQEGEE